jgi:MoaA/NifB/PqqE/SkfB family radical SAM enzyme
MSTSPIRALAGIVEAVPGARRSGRVLRRRAKRAVFRLQRVRGRIADRPAAPPRFLFVQINKRCNLRCGHCNFWHENDDDRANYLTSEREREVLEEFAAMNPAGRVVICGGEPMLDLERYFGVAQECRRLGLRCLSVVNGTRIRNAGMADRLIEAGPHEISISLNSHREELHDETRGARGAFRMATSALRLLLEARKRHPGSDTRIYVMGLIFDQNYKDIPAFYDFVLDDIGADKLKLNFLQPSFGDSGEVDEFFAEHGRLDAEELGRTIARADEERGLGLNPVWLGQVQMYARALHDAGDRERGWQSTAGTPEHICNTYERNIMLDHYGVARLCFSTLFRGEQLHKRGDLRRFWETSGDIRSQMRQCNRFCGISHSVRRESSTLVSATRERQLAAELAGRGG